MDSSNNNNNNNNNNNDVAATESVSTYRNDSNTSNHRGLLPAWFYTHPWRYSRRNNMHALGIIAICILVIFLFTFLTIGVVLGLNSRQGQDTEVVSSASSTSSSITKSNSTDSGFVISEPLREPYVGMENVGTITTGLRSSRMPSTPPSREEVTDSSAILSSFVPSHSNEEVAVPTTTTSTTAVATAADEVTELPSTPLSMHSSEEHSASPTEHVTSSFSGLQSVNQSTSSSAQQSDVTSDNASIISSTVETTKPSSQPNQNAPNNPTNTILSHPTSPFHPTQQQDESTIFSKQNTNTTDNNDSNSNANKAPVYSTSPDPESLTIDVTSWVDAFNELPFTLPIVTGAPTFSSSPSTPPTKEQTNNPTINPSPNPSKSPSGQPTQDPTRKPTNVPSVSPTKYPSGQPTKEPTNKPTNVITQTPTKSPLDQPTEEPTNEPTYVPSRQPTKEPTRKPTDFPSRSPTKSPSDKPTKNPTTKPTRDPLPSPSNFPSQRPTTELTSNSTDEVEASTPVYCLTREECDEQRQKMGFQYYMVGDHPMKGCFQKDEVAYFGLGGTVEEMSSSSLGEKIRISCDDLSEDGVDSNDILDAIIESPSTQPNASEDPSSMPSRKPTSNPTSKPSKEPTRNPTRRPTRKPSKRPTRNPTTKPTTSDPSSCFTVTTYNSIDADIETLKNEISDEGARSHFLGGILRLAAHDFMDFDPFNTQNQMGPDGCFDPAHPANAGLPQDIWCRDCALQTLYDEKYSFVSRADFWIASANAVVRQTSVNNALDLRETFVWGREDADVCVGQGDRLPSPTGCDDVENVFVRRMGLGWKDAVALMGGHTLGRGSSEFSGHQGTWVDTDEDAQVFDKQYYEEIYMNSWRPRGRGTANQDWTTGRPTDRGNTRMMLNTDICLVHNIDGNLPCCTNPGRFYSNGQDRCLDDEATARRCPIYNQMNPRSEARTVVGQMLGGAYPNDNNEPFYNAFTDAWRKATTVGNDNLSPLGENCEQVR